MPGKWEVSKGGFDDFEMVVKAAQFGTDPQYVDAQGEPQQVLVLYYDSDITGKEERILLSIGRDWNIIENGERVTHSSGKDKDFNEFSTIGRWVTRFCDLKGMEEVLDNPKHDDPRRASSFVGLRLHVKRETVKGFDGRDQEVRLPQEFLGLVEVGAPASASVAAPADPATQERERKKLMRDLKKLATAAADSEGFADDALALAGLPSEIEDQLLDVAQAKTLYDELLGG
jgi:hypothetical protein